MTAAFDNFIETSLEHVPPEFERNFNLIKDLDKRSSDFIPEINQLIESYRQARFASERSALRNEIMVLMEKILSYADDKVELAVQTYELLDKNIKQLISIGNDPPGNDVSNQPPIGCDMPLDPNEPTYCICRGVSHGEMVACDDKDCTIEWFHLACLNLTAPPKGKWFCPYCKKNATKTPRRRRPKKHY